MNFDLSSDQKMLVDTAATFAKKSSPVQRLRRLRGDELGFEKKVWRQMGELGWLGILYPDELGGFGGQFQDAALVLEQFGTTLVPEPYIPAVILGGMPILRAGTDEQKQRLLVPLIDGASILALAWAERHSRFDVSRVEAKAEPAGDSYVLSGEKQWVLCGHAANHLVVSAGISGQDGVSLFVVDAAADRVDIQPVSTMDGHRAAQIRFDGAKAELVGSAGAGAQVLEDVMDLAAAAACAEGVGITQAVLDMTVDYLKTREQFGTRIGAFQVLQHRAVDMFVQMQLCRSMSLEASIRMDEDDRVARQSAVSAAKTQLSTGGRHVVRQGIQLHGGIGCTDEHDIGLYFKRMQVLTTLFGDEEFHVTRYASLPSFAA